MWQYAAMAGFQVAQGYFQSENIKKQAEIQREIGEFNAQLAEYDAWKTQADGQYMIAMQQQQVKQATSSAKVRAAAVGADLTTGSLRDIMAQNEFIADANRLNLQTQITEKAMGYQRQATGLRAQAAMGYGSSMAQAQNVMAGSLFQAGGTMLQGLPTKVASDEPLGTGSSSWSPSGYSTMYKGGMPGQDGVFTKFGTFYPIP